MQDVGHAVLESYSRILESLAFTVLSRIEDVLLADQQTQNPSHSGTKSSISRNPVPKPEKSPTPTPKEEVDKSGSEAMTLSDFMGWNNDQGDSDAKKDHFADSDDFDKNIDNGKPQKLPNVVTDKKVSYLETLGGMRSPTSRH